MCLSLATLSCDNGESDSSINNLSDFAKEFVSTHMDSYNSMNMDNEARFSQAIQNALNGMTLMMVVWCLNHLIEKRMTMKFRQSLVLRQR